MMKYEKISFRHDADEILLPFCEEILNACQKSEFQFLSGLPQKWVLPSNENFRFPECCCVQDAVPVYSQSLWDGLTSVLDTDGIFVIPLDIVYHGEQHSYVIAVPSRIRCLDEKGKILPEQTGRYQMFKSENLHDHTIYVCGSAANYLKQCCSVCLINCK